MTAAPSKRILLALLCLFAIFLFIESPKSWLFDPDEARYAEIPQQMISTGDFITPKLNGSNYFEKPPLLYWLNALSFKTLGETPFSARLPTRLATLGIALLMIYALKGLSSGVRLWAAVVYLSSLLPFALGRINLTDALVSLGLTLTLLAARNVLFTPAGMSPKIIDVFMFWAGAALSVMSKGLIGLVLPFLILMAWVGLMGGGKKVFQIVLSRSSVLFLVATIPWFVLIGIRNPSFARIFFIQEHVLRYFTDGANRLGSFLYFVPVGILGLLPWTFFLVPAVKPLFARRLEQIRRTPNELYFGLWFLVIFLFFSLSRSKLIPYLLPAFPAAAALIGIYLAEGKPTQKILIWTNIFWVASALLGVIIGKRSGFIDRFSLWPQIILILSATLSGGVVGFLRAERRTWEGPIWQAIGWVGCYAVLISIVPLLARDYSQHDLATRALHSEVNHVVCFQTFSHSFPLVLKRPIPVVGYQGELASDGVMPPELFWSQQKFWLIWNSDARVIAFLPKDTREQFDAQPRPPFYLAANRKYSLAANYNPQARRRASNEHASGS